MEILQLTVNTPAYNKFLQEATEAAVKIAFELGKRYIHKEKFVGVKEAATITGLSEKYIYNLSAKKEIPHYNGNAGLRFSEDELIEWMKSERSQKSRK